MRSFFPQPSGLTVREIVELTGAVPRDGARARYRRHRHRGARSGAVVRPRVMPTTPNISTGSRRRAPAFASPPTGFAEHAPAALTVLRTAQPFRDFVVVARQALSGFASAAPAVRHRRRGAGRDRAPDGGDRGRRDDRSRRGDRPARGDRRGDRDRRDRGDRSGRADRPRLLGRSGRLDHACADRRQRHAARRLPHRTGRLPLPSERQGARQGSAARPRHHPGQRRDRRQHRHRPRRHGRHRDRRGDQDR